MASAGRRAVVASLIVVEGGSTYRRPGAKLLVEDDGKTRGSVSGGRLEADVREVALAVMRELQRALAQEVPRLVALSPDAAAEARLGVAAVPSPARSVGV